MGFKVFINPIGKSIDTEAGESILDALLRNGISIPYNCRSAICGACKGRVLKGTVDYGDTMALGLSLDDKEAGIELLCSAIPTSDVTIEVTEVTDAGEIEIQNLPARVEMLEKLSHDVIRVCLKLPPTMRMAFFAGQYVDILLGDGRARSFSIANAPHDDALIELHIRHVEKGSYTDYVFNEMKEKEMLRIKGPLGRYYIREKSDRPMIMVAGGTGFAPIKGMIEHARAEGMTRPIHLYWGARSKADLYLNDLAMSWAEDVNISYTPVLSDPLEEDNWQGRTGFVHDAVLADLPDLRLFEAYVSGPPIMVDVGGSAFIKAGLSADHIYSDAFEYAPDTLAKLAQLEKEQA